MTNRANPEERPPGPHDPGLVPGDLGNPSREELNRLAATLGMFNWLEANGFIKGELERLHAAFMWEWGPVAQQWLDQADPPPSWQQMAELLKENQCLKAQEQAANPEERLREAAAEFDLFFRMWDGSPERLPDYIEGIKEHAEALGEALQAQEQAVVEVKERDE